jgi:hypothetical protein
MDITDGEVEESLAMTTYLRGCWRQFKDAYGPYGSEEILIRSVWRTLLVDQQGNVANDTTLEALGIDEILIHNRQIENSTPEEAVASDGVGVQQLPSNWFPPKLLDALLKKQVSDKLFLTTQDQIGRTFGIDLKVDDFICIIFGCNILMAVRRVGSHWELVGGVYVDVIMYREALRGLARGEENSLAALNDFNLH